MPLFWKDEPCESAIFFGIRCGRWDSHSSSLQKWLWATRPKLSTIRYRGSYDQLSQVNGGSIVYGGVTWEGAFYVAGDLFIPRQDPNDMFSDANTEPFATPHSGNFAIFNAFGYPSERFQTSMYLTGVWFSRAVLAPGHEPPSATNVTVVALAGTTVLGSVSMDLVDSAPVFMDTSAFLGLSGITGYRIDARGPSTTGYAFYIADDFQFASLSPAEICPCDAPWRNRGEYVRCVREVLSALVDEAGLTHTQARDLTQEAVKSNCGRR